MSERFQEWVRTLRYGGVHSTPADAFEAGYERGLRTAEDGFADQTFKELERRIILAAVKRAGDNLAKAARQLGIGRNTIGRKLCKYEWKRGDV